MKKINLFLDTSNSYLILLFFHENESLLYLKKNAYQKHNEIFIKTIKRCLKKINLNLKMINSIYLIIGPGSFTSIKVGLTFTITLYTIQENLGQKLNIYVYDSLSFQAGKEKETFSYLNASAKKYYFLDLSKVNKNNNFDHIKLIDKEELLLILKNNFNFKIVKNYQKVDLQENFFWLKEKFIKIKKIIDLKPLYMKNYDQWSRNN
jgi:tRNA threonylcarbamoyladenosine biosynthesis protein TsaB